MLYSSFSMKSTALFFVLAAVFLGQQDIQAEDTAVMQKVVKMENVLLGRITILEGKVKKLESQEGMI